VTRPSWVSDELFPFESHFIDVEGANVHYIDEGQGPVMLCLHGNPTWSFLYRHIVTGLRDRFRCIAVDYPGFGLSTAPPGYGYRIVEHARVIEAFVDALGLQQITLIVGDWGGPIGMWNATRHPERFRAFVIGNTWAWPAQGDKGFEGFSKAMGSSLGQFAIKRLDFFQRVLGPGGPGRGKLPKAVKRMYRRTHPTPADREPVAIMPREILEARALLQEIEEGFPRVAHLPALIVWGARDRAFQERHRERWEQIFPNHRTVILESASHFFQEDAPLEVVSAIRAWWPGETASV
jgi:haloalkane dehalogenase